MRTAQVQPLVRLRRLAFGWQRDATLAGKELAGDRAFAGDDVGQLTLRHDLATVHAGARADVDDVVGQPDRVFVVFHHDHGIAQIAQPRQRAEQAFVVALVQADGWLVQHIHHADQAGADLAGQPDALGFAAGERIGLAVQGQVIQPDIDQEAQPLADFLDDALRDLAAPTVQFKRAEPAVGRVDWQCGQRR